MVLASNPNMTHHCYESVIFAYWFIRLEAMWHMILLLLTQHYGVFPYYVLCFSLFILPISNAANFFLCDKSLNASRVVPYSLYGMCLVCLCVYVYVFVNENIWRHFHFNIDSTQQTKIISNASRLYFKLSISLFFVLLFVISSFLI